MERILTLHPEGKKGVHISAEKYEQVRIAILEALESSCRFDEFFERAKSRLYGFEGAITWYVESVKLDLEARKIIFHDRKTRQIRLLNVEQTSS